MRFSWIVIAAVFALGLTGCETAKGFSADVTNTAENVSQGWANMKKADGWVQENLW